MWDPALILATMAAHTKHIGLIGTMSTSFIAPYDLAQKFRTLDQLSGGRAAWNIITSSTDGEAQNFDMEQMPSSEERYRRADEFVEVCKKLWESWDADALVMDKASGVFADLDKVHAIDHKGENFSVKGPLHLPPSPQRRPMLVQAGSSEQGRDFAAKHADAIFTIQPLLEDAIDVLRRDADTLPRPRPARRRRPDPPRPRSGTWRHRGRGQARTTPSCPSLVLPEKGTARCSRAGSAWTSARFRWTDRYRRCQTRARSATSAAPRSSSTSSRRNDPTLRELAAMIAGGRGHHVFVGTGEQLADEMETWVKQGAADGFNVMPLLLPRGLTDFAEQVIPILQDRGLFRTEYEAGTLRERYGLGVSETAKA